MLFKGKKQTESERGIFINNTKLTKTDQAKFLGVIIASNLSWQPHIDYISRKVSKSIGILYKLSKYLKKSTLVNLYYSLIYPYLIYCNEVWGLGCATHRRKLFTLQKRAIRTISYSARTDSSQPIFKQLRILKIHDLNSYLVTIFMNKFFHRELPYIFNDMFYFNSSIHAYATRQSSEFHVPLVKTNYTKCSIRYAGVILWNQTVHSVPFDCTLPVYKKNLKQFYIANY